MRRHLAAAALKGIGVDELLRRVPKAELHLHLRGAIPQEVLIELLNRYSRRQVWREASAEWRSMFETCDNIRPFLAPEGRSRDDVSNLFRYQSFEQFVATYAFVGCFIRTVSDLRSVISGVLESLKAQNVVYAEITASIHKYTVNGIPLADVLACLDEATDYAGLRVQWILGLVRDYGPESTLGLLQDVLEVGCTSVVGVTLAGSEHSHPPSWFSEVYALARERGLRLTAHAGEALGPESIWDALEILGVERVGHGVRAVEDERLMTYLAERQIPLEVCLTSNIRTGIFPSHEAHAVKTLVEAGIPVAINTDDPVFFETTLVEEYDRVHGLGFEESEIYKMIENGFRYAFLTQGEIEPYLGRLQSEWQRFFVKGLSGDMSGHKHQH
jgi:adenosine deaminase